MAATYLVGLFDSRHVLYHGAAPEYVRAWMTDHVFTWRMLGVIAEYRVAREARIAAPALWPTMAADIDLAMHVVRRQLGGDSSATTRDLAAARYLSAKGCASDPYFASVCAEWARMLVEVPAPQMQLQWFNAAFNLDGAGSSLQIATASGIVEADSTQWDEMAIAIRERGGSVQSITNSRVFEDGSRFLLRNDLASGLVSAVTFDGLGNELRSSSACSMPGAACNKVATGGSKRGTVQGCLAYA